MALRAILVAVVMAGLALVPVAARVLDEPFYLDLFGRIIIYALAAQSLGLILGFGGMVSFGHAAYLGIGGYAVAILASHGVESALVQWPTAVLMSAAFAFLTGLVSLRTSGVYFIMVTLAFAQMLFYFFSSLEAYGGDDGLTVWTRSTFPGVLDLDDDTALYYVALGLLSAALLLSHRLVDSRFGMVIRGAKSNERRMHALGYPVFRYKLTAFTIVGAMGGLAGALLANEAEFVSPNVMHWSRSGEILVMVILGGMGSVFGPVLGAVSYLLLDHYLAELSQHWRIVFGPALVLVVLLARGGIWGALATMGPRRA